MGADGWGEKYIPGRANLVHKSLEEELGASFGIAAGAVRPRSDGAHNQSGCCAFAGVS